MIAAGIEEAKSSSGRLLPLKEEGEAIRLRLLIRRDNEGEKDSSLILDW